MKLTKKKAKDNLSKLIKKFERELDTGRVYDYNEEATKISFIQPLLQDVLGWNVRDNDEVSPEERISRGRVDYGLKMKGVTKVFVEAKPVKADLNKHIQQAVRYGYNKKSVPFVMLTDFEGIKLFDVTVKPDSKNILKGLKIDLQWNNYVQEFDKLWLLSKDSVIKGELDELLLVKPKHRIPVDKAILEDLKRWRVNLAKDIFKNNESLFHSGDPERDSNYLKEINQKILDRIIFMRSCEDRGLVQRRSLKELFEERTEIVGTSTMVFLRDEFKYYNEIFNSDLFRPQEWENDLAIDFKIMRDIILDTYNPYQFDVIPLEVLGNIYEQYLGYTIRLTDHQVKYELKPEVRKAGGVYYTPEYIVDYIVKNTVGKSLQELSPRKIKKLRILDPACGSGSFLIRAYDDMLNYYRNQKKKKSKLKVGQRKLKLEYVEATPRLTIHEKSKILREHIFGVDLDKQAVEVTKLSLMLKMLEGEYGSVLGRAVLPMLDRNIRCGNSLISGDILELKEYFGEEWYKVEPFNWMEEFREIMVQEGGFDAVIGNPPYVSIKGIKWDARRYYEKVYCVKGRFDLYMLFMLRAINSLKQHGYWSFIIPNKFATNLQFGDFRRLIATCCIINSLVTYEGYQFKGAGVNNMVISCNKDIPRATDFIYFKKWENHRLIHIGKQRQSMILSLPANNYVYLQDSSKQVLFNKIRNTGKRYDFFFDVKDGIVAGSIKRVLFSSKRIDSDSYKLYFGKGVGRYSLQWTGIWVNYKPKEMMKLETKIKGSKRPGLWMRDRRIFEDTKILTRKVGIRIIATLDDEGVYYEQTLHGSIPHKFGEPYNIRYFLGILNSTLMKFYYQTFVQQKGKLFPQVRIGILKALPIPTITFSVDHEKKLHDELVALVTVMLELNKKIQIAKGSKKDQLQRQIKKTDREIDEIVYKLYGVTNEERKIIEATS